MTEPALPIPIEAVPLPAAEFEGATLETRAAATTPATGEEGVWLAVWRWAQFEQSACGAKTGAAPELEAGTEEEKQLSDPSCCWILPVPQTPPQPPPATLLFSAPAAAPEAEATARTVESSSWTVAADTAAPTVFVLAPEDGEAAEAAGLKAANLVEAPEGLAGIQALEIAPEPDGTPAAAPRRLEPATRGPLANHPVAEVLLRPRSDASPFPDLVQPDAPGAEQKDPSQTADPDGGCRGHRGETVAAPLEARPFRSGIGVAPELREAPTGGRFPDLGAGAEVLSGEAGLRTQQAPLEPAEHQREGARLHAQAEEEQSRSAAQSPLQPAPEPKLAGAGAAVADVGSPHPPMPTGRETASNQEGPRRAQGTESLSAAASPDTRPELPRSGSHLDVQVEGDRGERVRIRLWDAAGSVRMRVTSSERRIAEVLRSGWPQLERALEQVGWRAENAPSAPLRPEEWRAVRQPGLEDEAAPAARLILEPSHESAREGHSGRDQSSGRDRPQDKREAWIELSALRRLGAWRQS